MLFGLLIFLFSFICLLLILVIVLTQKGSGSLGLGNFGGANVALFGGSGGKDIFQKITWILGALFIGGSLVLSIMKTQHVRGSRYLDKAKMIMPRQQAPANPQQEQKN